MEQVERAGVHSGDSLALLPARSIDARTTQLIVGHAARIATALPVRGFLNVQFVIWNGVPHVLEVNLRASRTVPFVSKATGIPIVRLATEVMLGRSLADLGYAGVRLLPAPRQWAVKAPVFSSGKLFGADPLLGPEMRSTGEVMGTGPTVAAALRKAYAAAGVPAGIPRSLFLSVADRDKADAVMFAAAARTAGFEVAATPGTASALRAAGLAVQVVGAREALDLVKRGRLGAVLNTPTRGFRAGRAGFALRRAAVELSVPIFTSLDSARAFLEAVAGEPEGELLPLGR
jgi:carbamoyl-phosphate synthase large subunit